MLFCILFYFIFKGNVVNTVHSGVHLILDKMNFAWMKAGKTSVTTEYHQDDADIDGMKLHVIYECENCGNLTNMSTEMLDQIPGMASHSLVKGYCIWCAPIEEWKEEFKLLYNVKSKKEKS